MDFVANFKPEQEVTIKDGTAYIGTIDNIPAIYIVSNFSIQPDDVYKMINSEDNECSLPVSVRLIYPASKEHIMKYTRAYVFRTESYEEYLQNDDFIKTNWLDNIILKKNTGEEIYYEDEDFMIINDYKWDRRNMKNMYILLIFKEKQYRSVRDFNNSEILKKAKSAILDVLKKFEVAESSTCMFFHYRPSYFRAHIHIVNISTSLPGTPTRNIFLDEVIKNLDLDSEYYKKDVSFVDLQ